MLVLNWGWGEMWLLSTFYQCTGFVVDVVLGFRSLVDIICILHILHILVDWVRLLDDCRLHTPRLRN